jgi:hypothetical protein
MYLYFLGLSLRNTSRAMNPFKDENTGVTYMYRIGFKDLQNIRFTKGKEYWLL